MGWLQKLTRRDDDREKWLDANPGKRNLSEAPEQSPEYKARVRATMEEELDAQRSARGSE